VRKLRAFGALVVVCAVALGQIAGADDDAAAGYARVRPALVKVWAFDVQGKPLASGTGLVIASNAARSLVLTAAHVVVGAAAIRIDVDRAHHDIPAAVQQRGPRDLAVLAIDRGGFAPATFAPRTRAVVEGNLIAVAGFVEHDELIGVVGQEPQLLYPGTISSRPDDGAYLELENVHIEEGLSGAPVFDPENGDVLGIVTSRTADRRGGFADAAASVVLPFLGANAIAFSQRRIAAERVATGVIPKPTASPRASAAPRPAARPVALAVSATVRAHAQPVRAVAAAPLAAATLVPRALPTIAALPRAWHGVDDQRHRVVYDQAGCAIALWVRVEQIAFERPDDDGANAAPDARLTLGIERQVAPTAACANIDDVPAYDADYRVSAVSYDGRHLTMRFRFDADAGSGIDAALVPADVSLDADLDASPVTAHIQLIDAEWADAFDVSAATDP
jgi:hypothetical protein